MAWVFNLQDAANNWCGRGCLHLDCKKQVRLNAIAHRAGFGGVLLRALTIGRLLRGQERVYAETARTEANRFVDSEGNEVEVR